MSRYLGFIRTFMILVVITISLGGKPTLAQNATVVKVTPAAQTAQINDVVNFLVTAENVANLTAFELHLSFNANIMEVTNLANGGFVAADFVVKNVFDNSTGTIDYAIAQMNRPAVQGSGALLNISFRIKATGNARVDVRSTPAVPAGLLLVDPDGVTLPTSWVGGSVNIPDVVPMTTPTSTPTVPSTPATIPPTATSTGSSAPIQTTPTATITATPTATATTVTRIHTVRWGEYLYCIGRAYQVSPWAIAEANQIGWPYILFPNQKLIIPTTHWVGMTAGKVCQPQFSNSLPASPTPQPTNANQITATPPVVGPTSTPVPAAACRTYYIVKRGDTLYRIAITYGTTYTELAQINNIANARLIYAGQQLCIP